jgi:hypothetical protein
MWEGRRRKREEAGERETLRRKMKDKGQGKEREKNKLSR